MTQTVHSKTKINIAYIADCPESISQIATWLKSYWGIYYPQRDMPDWEKVIQLNKDKIPFTLVAYQGSGKTKHFMGTATLSYAGMNDYRKEEVWLRSVFTNPSDRNKGVASALIQAAIDIAEKLNIETIMLCTYTDGKLYQKLGWQIIDTVNFRGKSTLIMERKRKL